MAYLFYFQEDIEFIRVAMAYLPEGELVIVTTRYSIEKGCSTMPGYNKTRVEELKSLRVEEFKG